MKNFSQLKDDFRASLVVFLIALPLCLGIAVASGAPPLAGLVSGILGGLVVGSLSGSRFSVSGPAAGLTAIVFTALQSLPSYSSFLTALMLAGIFQVVLGLLKAGAVKKFFPSSVIHGMLGAIGLLLILKQLPNAFGYISDNDVNTDKIPLYFQLKSAITEPKYGVWVIAFASFLSIVFLSQKRWNHFKIRKIVPPALVAVLLGTCIHLIFSYTHSDWLLEEALLVNIPIFQSLQDVFASFSRPTLLALSSLEVWKVAITIALIASIETLLSLEAADKLDVEKRISPPNQELLAQGAGNFLAAFLGAIPITSVIVRSSANIQAGAKSKNAAIFHGVWLLLALLVLAPLLNYIPLASLAAVLIYVGYQLIHPQLIQEAIREGKSYYLPFFVTIFVVLFTDLLVGIGVGMFVHYLLAYISRKTDVFN